VDASSFVCVVILSLYLKLNFVIYSLIVGTFKYAYKTSLDIQGVSRLVDITAGGDFLGLCDQKRSYKHVSDLGWLRCYGYFLIPVHALV
jgi:hypothetical protein